MKLSLKVLAVAMTAAIMITGCVSGPENENSVQKESPKTEKPSKKEPDDPPDVAFAKKLQAKLKNNDIEGALELFDTIPPALGGQKDMIFLHASLYISAGKLDKASELAKELETVYPDDLEVLELNAVIAKNSKNSKAYKTYSNKILALDPYNSSMNIQIGQEYALNKKWKNARNAYNKALQNDPDNEDALFGSGLMSFYLSDDTTAKNQFEKILEKNPEHSMALCYMGKLAAENENYLSAVKYIQAALKSDPKNYDFYMDYGSYLHQQNKNSEALKQWTIASELEPDYFLAYAYLAGLNDELNNYEEALINYRKVIETNPDYYYAYESAAVLEWHEGNWAAAREDFQKAFITGGSTNWSYALMIAATYMKENNQFKAKEVLTPVMKKMDKESLEYQMVKFYYDNYSRNGANTLMLKINKEESSLKRGKLLFYFGLYNEIYGATEAAIEYYGKVASMQAAMFFEYRLAEWGMGLNK